MTQLWPRGGILHNTYASFTCAGSGPQSCSRRQLANAHFPCAHARLAMAADALLIAVQAATAAAHDCCSTSGPAWKVAFECLEDEVNALDAARASKPDSEVMWNGLCGLWQLYLVVQSQFAAPSAEGQLSQLCMRALHASTPILPRLPHACGVHHKLMRLGLRHDEAMVRLTRSKTGSAVCICPAPAHPSMCLQALVAKGEYEEAGLTLDQGLTLAEDLVAEPSKCGGGTLIFDSLCLRLSVGWNEGVRAPLDFWPQSTMLYKITL